MFNVQQLQKLQKQAVGFAKKNYLWIILAVLFFVVAASLSTKEGFEDFDASWKNVASFPSVFTEKVATPFLKENTFINYYLPAEKPAGPVSIESQQLELEGDVAKVPIDIGNGLAVQAVVKVQPQTVDLKAQKSVKIEEPKVTDVKVEAQSIDIPEQEGVIPGKMSEDGEMIAVPVKIEAQTIEIEEQNAIIPTVEAFRSV